MSREASSVPKSVIGIVRMIGARTSLLVVLLGLFACVSLAYEDIILPPSKGKIGPTAVLYFNQGADILTSQYVDLMKMIQDAVSFPLWVGIAQCPNNSCISKRVIKSSIDRISRAMKKQGMFAKNTFVGGHSLGGAMTPSYVKEFAPEATGMLLLASFLTHEYKTGSTPEGRPQVEFPVPSLTIGGDLDGLCRITRIAEALYSQVTFSADPDAAMTFMPVTALQGLDHMSFASGEPSSFVKNFDLRSEISPEEAHVAITKDASLFLNMLVTKDTNAINGLKQRVQDSQRFLQPITDALKMEAFQQFLPPCYCEAEDEYGYLQYGTCIDTPSCSGGAPWTSVAQQIMGGVTPSFSKSLKTRASNPVDGLRIVSTDSLHLVTEERPSCHLPHIHGNPENAANPGSEGTPPICAQPNGCELNITTVTQHAYHSGTEVDIWRFHFQLDSLDTGFLPVSAAELKTKLKSRQAVWQAAGLLDTSFNGTDAAFSICGEINQASIDWALSQLPEAVSQRYAKYGQQMVVGEDLSTCIAGPCWIWDPLRYVKDDEANTLTLKSVWFATENVHTYPCGEDKLVPCATGFHYCKLLSPARALEWMYVDSLRNKYGTKDV